MERGRCPGAFHLWTQEWTGEDLEKRETLIGSCSMLEQFGPLRGYDVVRLMPVGPNLVRAYILLRHEKQPVYLLLVAYRPSASWKIVTVTWNTDFAQVFPATILPSEDPPP